MANPTHRLRSRGPLGHGTSGERIADARARKQRMIEDAAKAAVEDIMRLWVASASNTRLIAEARQKNGQILRGDTAGPRHHNAIVKTLFEMLHTLERRIQQAPRDKQTLLPKLDGVKWDPNDPLAPLVDTVHPFQMSNFWTMRVVPDFPTPRRAKRRRRRPTPPPKRGKPKMGDPGLKLPGLTAPSGLGKGLEGQKGKGLKEGLTDMIKGKPKDILEDILSEAIPAFEILLLGKTAYDYLVKWIYAKDAGIKMSERRAALRVLTDAIAGMAVDIKDPSKIIPRGYELPEKGATFQFRPRKIPLWVGVDIPKPNARGVAGLLETNVKRDMQAGAPLAFARGAVARGKKKGLEYAASYIEKLNYEKGKGTLYLWKLKKKFRNNRTAIREHLIKELREQLCEARSLTFTQRNECVGELPLK
jgi:hypothetical protein